MMNCERIVNENEKYDGIIEIEDDFDLQKIMDSGQAFRIVKLDNGFFRFITGEKVLYMRQISENSYEVKGFDKSWYEYLDLSTDYRQIRADLKDDYLIECAEVSKGIRILKQDPFETILSFIISQRRNIPSIIKSVNAIACAYGKKIETEFETLYTFPPKEALAEKTEEDFKDFGLGYRLPYIVDAVEKANNVLNLEELSCFSDDELFEKLKSIKGVGDKVANCICLFAYARKNNAPVDVWIQRSIDAHYDGINPFFAYDKNAGVYEQYVFYKERNQASKP
ncbi:MAG: DNA-3-methyladenine glycosylase 2 family protein [Lachnospiraceae bacterium]|nr:DNA-3-methyladenine glycosylase 2 family protein [Lachnospiraceae bacterium]